MLEKRNKKAKSLSKWWYLVLIVVVIGSLSWMFYQFYLIKKDVEDMNAAEKVIYDFNSKILSNENASLGLKTKIIAGRAYSKVSNFLGFKDEWTRLKDFWGFAWVGLLAGLWIYLINKMIMGWILARLWGPFKGTAKRDIVTQRKSWMDMIGGRLWKVVIIAMIFGIAMLVPLVKPFIDVITFRILMPGSWFIQSWIVAFYIGFGPAAIEQYMRYRLRQKYYKQLMNVKYGVKIAKAMSSG